MEAVGRAVLGAILGGVGSVLLLGIGLIRSLVATLRGVNVTTDGVWPTILLYPVAFMLAGAAVGVGWPLRRHWLGRYALGVLGAGIVSAGIAHMVDGPVANWDRATYFATVMCTLIFGIVLARLLPVDNSEA